MDPVAKAVDPSTANRAFYLLIWAWVVVDVKFFKIFVCRSRFKILFDCFVSFGWFMKLVYDLGRCCAFHGLGHLRSFFFSSLSCLFFPLSLSQMRRLLPPPFLSAGAMNLLAHMKSIS